MKRKVGIPLYIGDKGIHEYIYAFIYSYGCIEEDVIDIEARGKHISKAVDVAQILTKNILPNLIDIDEVKIGTDLVGEGELEREVSRISIKIVKIDKIKRRRRVRRRKIERPKRPRLAIIAPSCNIHFVNDIEIFLQPSLEVTLKREVQNNLIITDPHGETRIEELKDFPKEGLKKELKPDKIGEYKVVCVLHTEEWGRIRRTSYFTVFPFLDVEGLKDSYLAKKDKLICYIKASPEFDVDTFLDNTELSIEEMKSRRSSRWHVYKLEHGPLQVGQSSLIISVQGTDIRRQVKIEVSGKIALNLDEKFYREHKRVRFYITKHPDVEINRAIVYPGKINLEFEDECLTSKETLDPGEYKITLYGKRIHGGKHKQEFILEGPKVDLIQGRIVNIRVFARQEPLVEVFDAVGKTREEVDLSLEREENGMKIYRGFHFCKEAEVEIHCEIAGYLWKKKLEKLVPSLFVVPSPFPKDQDIHFILQTSGSPTREMEESKGGAYHTFEGKKRAFVKEVEYPFLYHGVIREDRQGLGSIIYEEGNISFTFKVRKIIPKKFLFSELLNLRDNKLQVEPTSIVFSYLKRIIDFILMTTDRKIFVFLPNLRHSIVAHHYLGVDSIAMFGIYPEYHREKPSANLDNVTCPSCGFELVRSGKNLECEKQNKRWRVRGTYTFPFVIFCPRCGKDMILLDLDMRTRRCTDFGLLCENCGWFTDRIAFYDRDILEHQRISPRIYFVYFEPPVVPSKFGINLNWLTEKLPWEELCGSKFLHHLSKGFVIEEKSLANKLIKAAKPLPDQVIGVFLWKNRVYDNILKNFTRTHGMCYLALGDVG